ncbi:hypothetical protein HY251_04095 [bacterium]|nr:hypothetical protein [bacterium]
MRSGRLLIASSFALAVALAGTERASAQEARPEPGEPVSRATGDDEKKPVPSSPESEGEPEQPELDRRVHLTLGAYWLPFFGLSSNKHDNSDRLRPEYGMGWGARAGAQLRFISVGILYLESHHGDRDLHARITSFQGYLDVAGHFAAGIPRVVQFEATLGFGAGGVGLYATRVRKDYGGAACEGRIGLGVVLFERVRLGGDAGVFLFGYPTHTSGVGGFVGLGAAVYI